jgi:hypothetical protein
VGLTYTEEAKELLQEKEDFTTADCNITLFYTGEPDLSDFYSVRIPPNALRKNEAKGFIVMMLNTVHQHNLWQTFECPMIYPRLEYNWCVTGDNRQVRFYTNVICQS